MAQDDQVIEVPTVAASASSEESSGSVGASSINPLQPEMLAKIEAMRSKIQLSMGQVVLAIMDLPRYRHQSLNDLKHIVVQPLLQDRLAIAHSSVVMPDGSTALEKDHIVGIAIWASASDQVDAKISEQIKSNAFPIRLGPDDWVSGENIWLLDVIASDSKAATSVLLNFRKLVGEKTIKIHPMISGLIDQDVLVRLRESSGAGRRKNQTITPNEGK
ncbi:toxin-activating lysine-acyltransferase [Novosphingobium terrae]|uniref:toxin-activating lysine-acyltransferase n=1 Tax=Novosphingobium terrae TaxID=2726189 RepID=UPI00197E1E28|nr:toxin-activating lysine-acyltransferase [Novosphingobium terrae]